MKTIRRDKLLRLAKAGQLVAVDSYHFDDMSGESRMRDGNKPVRIMAEYGDFKEGFYNLRESDFDSSCGSAHLNDDGTITLYVHSNSNYTFRLVNGASLKPCNPGAVHAKLPENVRMQEFLKANGVEAVPKYFHDGSQRGCWRLYGRGQKYTPELQAKLTSLGFVDFDGSPLGQFSGNGGEFMVFVRGHAEFLQAA